MIISPPFLPERAVGQTEAQWLDVAMRQPAARLADTQASEGSFPVSHHLTWHNGMHLQAPQANGADLPVRAIADGTVIFARAPRAPNSDPDDPQNYNPFDRPGATTAAWTDNGCVIIEHRTTIGAIGNAVTEVVFYSLYMHLAALGRLVPSGQTSARPLQAGDAIWRKDEVGRAGQIYGARGQIHFEICLDAANLQRLIGRPPAWTEPSTTAAPAPAPVADGRVDAIFGSVYFYLPATTPVDGGAHMPTRHLRDAAPASTLGTAVWVKMTYDTGACTFETFDQHGASIGAMPAEAEAEYTLYQQAVARHAALPAARQTESSSSGWYELLRFGRNIGRGPASTDCDPLPGDAVHWRRIVGIDGHAVWADLNAAGSYKFSDADFLPVMVWNCIDDDTSPDDQRCDSARLKTLIRDPNPSNATRMAPEELSRRLGDEGVRKQLRRLFCKFPSEWEQATIEARYGFVQEMDSFKQAPEAWARTLSHIQGLSFRDLPPAYLAARWNGHPSEFMRQMRQCGWLSVAELAQCLPRNRPHVLSWVDAVRRSNSMEHTVNMMNRRYFGADRRRQAHVLAQVFIETDLLNTFVEYSKGNGYSYGAFYGRGLMQLTWPENYDAYGVYRQLQHHSGSYADHRINSTSTHVWEAGANPRQWAPRFDPEIIATDSFAAGDSGGFYWITKSFRGQKNILRVSDLGASGRQVGYASWLVNGGANGYRERQQYFAFLINHLMDSGRLSGTQAWRYPELSSALTSTFPPGSVPDNQTVAVDYAKQVP